MNQGTYPLAASMINQINRLDQISNNLANVNTNGFKEEGLTETTFNHYLQRAKDEGFNPTKENIVTNNIPKIDAKFVNGEMGPIMTTGNDLDFALQQPNLFFKVQNQNGDVVYTRDGSFKILDGFLVDSKGNQVLGPDNDPVLAEGNFAQNIGIVRTEHQNLQKIGDNTYKIKNLNEREIYEVTDGLLVQGAIEKSNVNSVTAMVELIDAHRRFDQSQKAVSSIDELNGKLIEKIGNNTR